MKVFIVFSLSFAAFFSSLNADEFHAFDAIKGFEKAEIFLPSKCLFKNDFGDMKITCNDDIVIVQAIKVELGCYESARTLVDLAGDDPRKLKIQGLNSEKIDIRAPFNKGIFTLDFTPAYEKSLLNAIIVCANGILLNFFGKNADLVKQIAINSKIS